MKNRKSLIFFIGDKMRSFRKQTIFICAFDNSYMELTKGKYNLYYKCAKYFLRNRNDGERACANYMSLKDQNNLYDELAWLEEEGELKVGKEGIVDSIHYEISNINDKIIKVKIRNIKVKARGHEN